MFKQPLALALIILFSLTMGTVFFISYTRSSDIQKYKNLEERAAAKNDNQLTYSQQIREGVCKEVWYQEQQKLNFRILSDYSTLLLLHENNQLDVVEQMEDVSCFMQEELYYLLPNGKEAIFQGDRLLIKHADPNLETSWTNLNQQGIIPMQIIRYLEAEKACYNYNTHLFLAEKVKIWRYRVKGHELIQTTKGLQHFMNGTAKNIEFALKGKQFEFTANLFKASFETTGGV